MDLNKFALFNDVEKEDSEKRNKMKKDFMKES